MLGIIKRILDKKRKLLFFKISSSFKIQRWEEFQDIIKYERIRADRDGSKFSLIVLDLEAEFTNSTRISKIIYHLKNIIRVTDRLGWFDEYKVGILLPLTDKEGAAEFIKKFDTSKAIENCNIQYHMYIYPDNWYQNLELPVKDKIKNTKLKSDCEKTNNHDIESVFVVRTPSWKRLLDIFISFFSLIIFSPLFLFIAVHIKLVSKGPVFYKSERVGKHCKKFMFYKFRTMHRDNNQNTHEQHAKAFINNQDKPMTKLDSKGDSRILPGGSLLRKTCIDELPQLLNVLKGDMSLVGPRPCIPYEAEEYQRWHTHRFDILPGITGLWQVSGKNKLSFQEMIRLDILYTKSISVMLDLRILLKTIPVVIGLAIENPSESEKDFKQKIGAAAV